MDRFKGSFVGSLGRKWQHRKKQRDKAGDLGMVYRYLKQTTKAERGWSSRDPPAGRDVATCSRSLFLLSSNKGNPA